ncbi:sodium- and chloride-dependent GABA transporter ine-like [Penaeus monodon]|uniref:sodium- and chloride-dependent GABA transporter ine-like n=1 Tax=Penaeus monodon TaxID=6687 RepID=UPI0018A76097|nr:sodium- and chloride-dependent GABA transporter ine-like [Penaeus monodon]
MFALQFGVVESLLTVVTSEFPQIRSWRGCVTFVICSVIFLGNGIIYSQAGIYWLTLVDWYVSSFTATLNCLCELLVFSFIYGVGRTIRDLQMMTNKTVSYFWYATWLVITPVLTVAIFVNMVLNYGPASYDGRRLPDWAQGIGWLTAFASILAIPGYFVYFLAVHTKGSVAQVSSGSSWRTLFPCSVLYRYLYTCTLHIHFLFILGVIEKKIPQPDEYKIPVHIRSGPFFLNPGRSSRGSATERPFSSFCYILGYESVTLK